MKHVWEIYPFSFFGFHDKLLLEKTAIRFKFIKSHWQLICATIGATWINLNYPFYHDHWVLMNHTFSKIVASLCSCIVFVIVSSSFRGSKDPVLYHPTTWIIDLLNGPRINPNLIVRNLCQMFSFVMEVFCVDWCNSVTINDSKWNFKSITNINASGT